MVLPLPTVLRPPEDAVRFISLKAYPEFFVDLADAFPQPELLARLSLRFASTTPGPLKVHKVGDFEASFVPCLDDFDRLDPRFRLPRAVWDAVPSHQDYSFAVFKLKAGARKAHPMAFEFPRRQPELLYFPTLHVHDGTVHPAADFDHVLYCQPEPGWDHAVHLQGWSRSPLVADRHVDISRAQGIVDPGEHLFRRELAGRRQNRDIWVSADSTYSDPARA
jgi:hypothetical protein